MSILQQVVESTKKNKKKKREIKRDKTHAIESNKRLKPNTYHEMTALIVLICTEKRFHETFVKSKLKIM